MTGTAVSGRVDPGAIAAQLQEARARTFLLVAPLSDEDLHLQHDPLMSPIIWDLGHIAHFEELWLTQNLDGPIEFVEMPGLYNPFEHPRSTRGALALPGLGRLSGGDGRDPRARARSPRLDLDSITSIRCCTTATSTTWCSSTNTSTTRRSSRRSSSSRGGRTRRSRGIASARAGTAVRSRARGAEMVLFPGGPVEIGTDDRSAAYDNERPRHIVESSPFLIDVHPVTNREFLRFIAAGGLRDAGVLVRGRMALEAGSGADRAQVLDRA